MKIKLVPIIAISCMVLTGCSQDEIEKMIYKKPVVQTKEVANNQDKQLKDEKSSDEKVSDEKANNDDKLLAKYLKLKKQLYLERLQRINTQYESICSEYETRKYTDKTLIELVSKLYGEVDKVLNEIYEELKEYVPEDKMEQIEKEQLDWKSKKEEQSKQCNDEVATELKLDQNLYCITEKRCKDLLDYLSSEKCEIDNSIENIIPQEKVQDNNDVNQSNDEKTNDDKVNDDQEENNNADDKNIDIEGLVKNLNKINFDSNCSFLVFTLVFRGAFYC